MNSEPVGMQRDELAAPTLWSNRNEHLCAPPGWRFLTIKLVALLIGFAGISGSHAANPPRSNEPNAVSTNTVSVTTDSIDDRVKLKAGDHLCYRVLEDKDEARPLVVSQTGRLDVPLIGPVEAQQRTCKEIAAEIKTALEKKFYQHATVILEITAILEVNPLPGSRDKIYIYGQVRSPGPQDSADGRLTLSTAILNAGGFSGFANGHKVKVFRKNPRVKNEGEITVDVEEILKKGLFEKDILLEPGDRVLVPEKFIKLF